MGRKKEMVRKTIQIVSLLTIFSLAACATTEIPRTAARKTYRPTKSSSVETGTAKKATSAEKEIVRPEKTQFASISNPARSASMELIQKGKNYLSDKDYNKAIGAFREAVIIDGTNGLAYYYLSKARYYLKEYEEAFGLLDKAEDLLSSSPEWTEAIGELRKQIERCCISQSRATRSDNIIPIINKPDTY